MIKKLYFWVPINYILLLVFGRGSAKKLFFSKQEGNFNRLAKQV